MNVIFNENELDFIACQEAYNAIDPAKALFLNHYELAIETGISGDVWKRFMLDHRVAEWVRSELELFKVAQRNKLIQQVTSNSRSVGTAQMLTAVNKTIDETQTKEGPVFVYCYIPLNPDEYQAPNINVIQEDPFLTMENEEDEE